MQLSSAPSSSPFRIGSPTLAREIKDYMDKHRSQVEGLLREGSEGAGQVASAQWAKVFDGLLCALFCALRGSVTSEKAWSSLALAAVGSYGRGTFGYKSDLDIRILCKDPTQTKPVAEALLYPLWDAGIQIGHQVITLSDTLSLAKQDLSTATTLLDWRHLAGNSGESRKLREKAFASLFSGSKVNDFLADMAKQAEVRWTRFGDSVYLLEPDVKHGQGGLRDLDVCHWIAQARWHVTSLDGLAPLGVMLPAELAQLKDAASFLCRIRNVLHFRSPRRTERLSFDSQELVADALGYGMGGAGCEALMSDYYRHARVISNSQEMLIVRAAPPPKKKQREVSLGGGIKVLGTSVALENPAGLSQAPEQALRIYWHAVHEDLPVDPLTREAIKQATTDEGFCERLRGSEEAARLFRRLVRSPRKVKFKRDSLLTEFHDVGILLGMIPEFRPVVGRVHHDIYHVYTVDAHSIACVDRLRAMCRGDVSAEFPHASRLAADIARPQCLFMACLLHDIGKDVGGRAHSERGFEMVATILARLGVQEHDIAEVQHLVLKHLRMYHVASRRDLDDPKTVEGFRDEVHGPEGLKELYLLTLCDVSTTSPQALTQWKRRMLEELYVSTLESFSGAPGRDEARAVKLREAARDLCPDPGEAEFMTHFLGAVPDRYLYANEPVHIAMHARMCRQAEERRHVVTVLGTNAPYVEIGVVVDDKPGTLAAVTAALAANRLRVINAQLYSWQDRAGRARVLDLFWVRPAGEPSQVKRQLDRVLSDIEQLLSGEVNPDVLLVSRRGSRLSSRPAPEVETVITFDNRGASDHTIVEVIAQDRSGLLYSLARALSTEGLEIALAKINTEGNAVADVFYVVDREGKKVTEAAHLSSIEDKLRLAVRRAAESPATN